MYRKEPIMFEIGNRVKVNTKFHGWQVGTIVGKADFHDGVWLIEIPGHWTKGTWGHEIDMRKA
tara:strand:- start:261 stop:449 length:189 start_codon:yes stop_codon:yes gene_type:complete